jgi:hypothetical protein
MPRRAALVTALILERPLCEDCILAKSGLSSAEFRETVNAVRSSLLVHDRTDRCRACGETARVLSLERPR